MWHKKKKDEAHHHRVTQAHLGNLALVDLFLDGAAGQEAIDNHAALLAISPDPAHCLQIRRRVPVNIKEDDPRGANQIESGSPGFGGEEKDELRGVLGVELVHQ